MHRSRILLGIMILAVALPTSSRGQEGDVVKALQALRRVAATYQQAQFLSFDILYRYAAETKPGVYLDSLGGQYKLHGNRYWSVLDNQESLYDNRLLLMVFKDDSIIYLVAPPANAGGGKGAAPSALAMLDSFMLMHKEAAYHYAVTDKEEQITMSFTGPAPCKEITWHIDRKTGYLTRMVSLMQADQLYDPSVRSLVTEGATAYVIVETLYRNYRQGAFDESVFDTAKYIKKDEQGYVTVAPYERYKVFLGTPGL